MNIKELGLRLGLSYFVKRSSGADIEESVKDSVFGLVVSESTNKIEKEEEISQQVLDDLVIGVSVKEQLEPVNYPADTDEVVELNHNAVANPYVGLSRDELRHEYYQLMEGIDEAYIKMNKLQELQHGVLRTGK